MQNEAIPGISFFSTVVLGKVLEITISELEDRIRRRITIGKEMRKLHEDLFGFLTSSEFILGERFPVFPEVERRICRADVELVEHIVSTIPFELKPNIKEGKMQVDYTGNICAIGHAISNRFSGFIQGVFPDIGVPRLFTNYLPKLRWRINYERDPRAADITFEERKSKDEYPPLNWVVEDSKTGREFIPFFNTRIGETITTKQDNTKPGSYTTDYLILIKTNSPHIEGRYILGSKVLVIAGCHPLGRDAFRLVLDDESILRKVHDKVGTDDFEALFEVHGKNEKAQSVRFIDAEPLYQRSPTLLTQGSGNWSRRLEPGN